MSGKRYPQVNLSRNSSPNCEDVIDRINNLVKKIKTGAASERDLTLCNSLTNYLQKFISTFREPSDFDVWVAKETVEMSRYVCGRYAHIKQDDKI